MLTDGSKQKEEKKWFRNEADECVWDKSREEEGESQGEKEKERN